jgi:DNA replication protein DnaC
MHTEVMAEQVCPLCEDRGMRIIEAENGDRHAEPCSCRFEKRARKVLEQARIPVRYEHCTLDAYESSFAGANASLHRAQIVVRKFINAYPLEAQGTGLLLTGSIGVGKTHLAVGLLRELIVNRGAKGLFYDYRELLKAVQNSYNQKVSSTEHEVLQPVFDAEVLVLDEIGASKPTDWVWDTVAHILNTRYNDKRTTILTTNYANLPPLGVTSNLSEITQARFAVREETLGDRIGERMRSRLQEMCVPVEMTGQDFRQHVKRAFLA